MKTQDLKGKKIEINPIGWIASPLRAAHEAPAQGQEAKVEGHIIVFKNFQPALKGLRPGDHIWVICWFHLARRDVLQVRPRLAREPGLAGVFASRSHDRPNPIGLELVKILKIDENNLWVEGLDAIDGTPVLDIKRYFPQIDCPEY